MQSKYRSITKTCYQGHLHHSRKEAGRCNELHLLQRAGEIKLLKIQPAIPLQKSFRQNGECVRGIKYIADFSYYDNKKKKFVVEDSKGFKTKDYLLKVKMLKFIMRDNEDFLFLES
jgi:hypothetical protein